MPELQRLNADYEAAVLAFELSNRSYFAAFISDRGQYFDHFAERQAGLLAHQEAGGCAYYVLVATTARSSAGPTSGISRTARPISAIGSPST